jgi:hypothetical protein
MKSDRVKKGRKGKESIRKKGAEMREGEESL